MRSVNSSFFALVVLIMFFSCSQSKSNSNESSTEVVTQEADSVESLPDASELTYGQVVEMVFSDDGERIEWHGEEMPNELLSHLVIINGDSCGTTGCGIQLAVQSVFEDKSIELIIRGDYDIRGDQGYIPRRYVIRPGQTASIGCSHLCYDGEAFEFKRKIVGSAFLKE